VKQLKVVVIGKENVGKTFLIKRLTNQWTLKDKALSLISKGTRESTDGVHMQTWSSQQLDGSFQIWDFAGQQTYYTTHQFFLSGKTLNILVFNMMERRDEDLLFWWHSIQSRSPGTNVMIVGTHLDKVKKSQRMQTVESISNWITDLFSKWCSAQSKETNFIQLRKCKWSEQLELQFFPGITMLLVYFYTFAVSCLKSTTEDIETHLWSEMERLLHIGEPVRKEFPALVNLIVTKSKEKSPPLVLRSELLEWVAEIFPDQSVEGNSLIISKLHDCGYILNYDWIEYVIIDPQWMADFFCTIISSVSPTIGQVLSSLNVMLTLLFSEWNYFKGGIEFSMESK
jgi:GTPase SAR1 family protein